MAEQWIADKNEWAKKKAEEDRARQESIIRQSCIRSASPMSNDIEVVKKLAKEFRKFLDEKW